MKRNRYILWWFSLLFLAIVPSAAFGADTPAAKPAGFVFNWQLLLPVIIPLVLSMYKQWLPNAPVWLLPIVAPVLGAAADIVAQIGGWTTIGAGWSALLGSAGVGLREAYDQTKKNLPDGGGTALFITLCFIGALVFGMTACGTPKLEAGGAYNPTNAITGQVKFAPETELFITDSAFKVSYQAIDVVFEFERKNRAALWAISPRIKAELDKLRDQAWKVNTDYIEARRVYLATKTPAALGSLNETLSKLQRLTAAAQVVIPTKGVK